MHPELQEGGVELLPCTSDFAAGEQSVLCLPIRVDGERLIYSTNTVTVVKLLREAGLAAGRPALDGETLFRDERALVWLGPVLFFTAAAVAETPELVSISLGVISNYLTDLFQGRTDATSVKLQIIEEIEPTRTYRRLDYDGPVEGLKNLREPIEGSFQEKTKR